MPFEKGREKTGGRQKGTPNRLTSEVIEQVAETGMTPVEYLASVFQDAEADPRRRDDTAKALLPYCYAKKAPVAVKDADGNVIGYVDWPD